MTWACYLKSTIWKTGDWWAISPKLFLISLWLTRPLTWKMERANGNARIDIKNRKWPSCGRTGRDRKTAGPPRDKIASTEKRGSHRAGDEKAEYRTRVLSKQETYPQIGRASCRAPVRTPES